MFKQRYIVVCGSEPLMKVLVELPTAVRFSKPQLNNFKLSIMNSLKGLINNIEDMGGYTSKSFKSFARNFKNDFAKELRKNSAKITGFNTGHYYVSGFFRDNFDRCYYFSISDIRHFPFETMLYRTAKDENDYTGGANQYVGIETGMIDRMGF